MMMLLITKSIKLIFEYQLLMAHFIMGIKNESYQCMTTCSYASKVKDRKRGESLSQLVLSYFLNKKI